MARLVRKLSSSQIIILGFAGVILIGSLLLMLPAATNDGRGAVFADAIFTATSAVCVTGLVVQDTGTYWSGFGQAVILGLIQIGGMGVVTVALAISIASGKKVTLKQRSTMQEAISAHELYGIVKMISFIICTTIVIELLGALAMAPTFCKDFGLLQGIWYAVFHSVSAFCNAGFDLMGVREPYSSVVSYVANPAVNITIMALIVVGGIGFTTWSDVRTNKFAIRKYRMQSKVILAATAFLIIVPALYFFFCELTSGTIGERILASLFQAITPRTAGFNTVDLGRFSETGLALIIILMLIGGAPGSTAGGMKATTCAVMLSTAVSVFRRKEHTHFFGRRISDDTIRSASTIMMMYLVLCITGGFVICKAEGLPLLACLFETASAVGTVGLTVGITTKLSLFSRVILIGLMYIGRVGGLTLIFSTVSAKQNCIVRLPQEKLQVG